MNRIYKKKIGDFLKNKNIAVLGYSTDSNQPANAIYKKLEKNRYMVFAVNPKADQITDVPCYANIKSIPEEVGAAVLCTPADVTESAVNECAENNIKYVWFHKGPAPNVSYDKNAFERAKELDLEVIPGGCPLMFVKPDLFHLCFGWFQRLPE
jgi:predicted CoA-binding protein